MEGLLHVIGYCESALLHIHGIKFFIYKLLDGGGISKELLSSASGAVDVAIATVISNNHVVAGDLLSHLNCAHKIISLTDKGIIIEAVVESILCHKSAEFVAHGDGREALYKAYIQPRGFLDLSITAATNWSRDRDAFSKS